MFQCTLRHAAASRVPSERLNVDLDLAIAFSSHGPLLCIDASPTGPPHMCPTSACIQHPRIQTAEWSCRLLCVAASRDDSCRVARFGGVHGGSSSLPSFLACLWQFCILSRVDVVPVAPGHRSGESSFFYPSLLLVYVPLLTADSPGPFIHIGSPSCPKPSCTRKIP